MNIHRIAFATSLTIASRVVHVRDLLLGRVPRRRPECPSVNATQHSIRSGNNTLDAVYVEPAAGPALSAVLVCHGIGETVPQWFPIQRLFAESGIASLVFDYSGYGRSTGFPDFLQCECDAIASFQCLCNIAPGLPVTLLGFSLGTGVAPAVLDRVNPNRLILCAGYTSFRDAARAAWIPPFLSFLVPPIWSAEEALRNCTLPILIVQGDHDRLFGMRMAQDLVASTAGRAELLVLPARSHNEPFYHPGDHYWSPIVHWILRAQPGESVSTPVESGPKP